MREEITQQRPIDPVQRDAFALQEIKKDQQVSGIVAYGIAGGVSFRFQVSDIPVEDVLRYHNGFAFSIPLYTVQEVGFSLVHVKPD